MKKSSFVLIILACLLLSSAGFAQDTAPTKIRVVGINFSSFNSFGVHFKAGSRKTLFRMSLVTLNGNISKTWGRAEDSLNQRQGSYGAGFRAGFEKPLQITKNLDFTWGLEAGCAYQYDHSNWGSITPDSKTVSWRVSPGLYALLGVTYTLKEHLVFGVEITPGIWDSYGKQTVTYNGNTTEVRMTNSLGFGFSTNFASLTVSYRFGK